MAGSTQRSRPKYPATRQAIMSSMATINMSNGPTTWFTSFSGDLYLRYQCLRRARLP